MTEPQQTEFAYLIFTSRWGPTKDKEKLHRACLSLEEAQQEADKIPAYKYTKLWIEKVRIPQIKKKQEDINASINQ